MTPVLSAQDPLRPVEEWALTRSKSELAELERQARVARAQVPRPAPLSGPPR